MKTVQHCMGSRWRAIFATICAAALAADVSYAADFTVSEPTVLSAEQSAAIYDNVYVNADLTIDGADRGLTNKQSITIGGSAAAPVTVAITNGASWYVATRQTLTFSGKGGTIVVSEPTAHPNSRWNWGNGGTRVNVLGDGALVYLGGLGTFGQYTDVKIDSNAEAEGGVMDIARLLPNGIVSFRCVENSNPNVAARILFEGGTHWVMNDDSGTKNRFKAGDNSRIILESVGGKPIYIRSLVQDYDLFKGTGVLETRGSGDLVLHHARAAADPTLRTITLSEDEGSIEWGHQGTTYLRGVATWKIGSDNFLPYGPQTGPVVIDCSEYITSGHIPTMLDLNGKSVKVNGLRVIGKNGYDLYCVVTNSSEKVASLCLNVETNAVLSGLITDKFAANASSNIRLQKCGAGTLTIDKQVDVAGFDVLEGMVVGTLSAAHVSYQSVTMTNGAAIMAKSPLYNQTDRRLGLEAVGLTVDAGDGASVLSNVWQNALTVQSGTARIENGSENILAAERPWRPTRSQIGAVSVEGGDLDVVRGCLSSTNISVAAGSNLRIRGGDGATNRVDFYTAALNDRYYRFIFKESARKKSFGLNHIYLWSSDGTRQFGLAHADSSTEQPTYTRNASATAASDLAEGEYMYSCPKGLAFVNETRTSGNCVYSADGLSARAWWGGVIINENGGLSLGDSSTWITLTIRLRSDASLPLVGYSFHTDWMVDRLTAWEVQASGDGSSWRTVDQRTKADVYTYGNKNGNNEGYGYFNGGEPFAWRSAAAGNAFNCEGSVQVDEGGVLDLSAVPDANISIKGVTVDASSGGGTIVKFRPAANGILNITGLVGDPPPNYRAAVKIVDAVDVANLGSWRAAIDGEVVRVSTVSLADGILTAHLTSGMLIIVR
ncbi:MAG: hypothetical protein IJI73_05020 [Kiritimatiellae bacterium]|nr:hypothetical protein [Kiritimatiellia bacterium]